MDTPESDGISRREVLKRATAAAAASGLHFPIPTPSQAIPSSPLKGIDISGTLNLLEDIYAEHSLFGDVDALRDTYEFWATDPEGQKFITKMMEKYGFVEKGERVTHATWKRVLKGHMEINESLKEVDALHERIERDAWEAERRETLGMIVSGIQNVQNSLLQAIVSPKKLTS